MHDRKLRVAHDPAVDRDATGGDPLRCFAARAHAVLGQHARKSMPWLRCALARLGRREPRGLRGVSCLAAACRRLGREQRTAAGIGGRGSSRQASKTDRRGPQAWKLPTRTRGRSGCGRRAALGDADASRLHPGAEFVGGHLLAVLAHVEPPRRVVEFGLRLVGGGIDDARCRRRRRQCIGDAAAFDAQPEQHLVDRLGFIEGLRQHAGWRTQLVRRQREFGRQRGTSVGRTGIDGGTSVAHWVDWAWAQPDANNKDTAIRRLPMA